MLVAFSIDKYECAEERHYYDHRDPGEFVSTLDVLSLLNGDTRCSLDILRCPTLPSPSCSLLT